MNRLTEPRPESRPCAARLRLFLLAVASAGLLAAPACSRRDGSDAEDGATYEVKRGPLTISVIESGAIKAREQIVIKSQVEGSTTILYLVPEGRRVRKGELLIELDASSLEDRKIEQEIRVQNGEAAFIRSRENLAVTRNQAESDIARATLNADFAEQDLKKYVEGEYPNQLKELEARITLSEEEVRRTEEKHKWSSILFAEKYLSQSELQADELSMKKAGLDLALATNNLALFRNYTHKRSLAELESNVKQEEMALERIKRKASADVVQAEADLRAKESEFGQQKDKLEKVVEQIAKTRITAPAEGLVVYATSTQFHWRGNVDPLAEGRQVREREELIYLPTASAFIADVNIHESGLDKIQIGLPARISIDAVPGKVLSGKVAKISPMPDAMSMFMNPDLKLYGTEIHLDEEDEELKTGMSCKAEIIVEHFTDAVYVPVQCVIRVGGQPTVYVADGRAPQPRAVEIGLDNNRMVVVTSGLDAGERVLLSPPLAAATEDEGERPELTKTVAPPPPTPPSTAAGPAEDRTGRRKRGGADMTETQREEMRKRVEKMTPEEREAMRKRFTPKDAGSD